MRYGSNIEINMGTVQWWLWKKSCAKHLANVWSNYCCRKKLDTMVLNVPLIKCVVQNRIPLFSVTFAIHILVEHTVLLVYLNCVQEIQQNLKRQPFPIAGLICFYVSWTQEKLKLITHGIPERVRSLCIINKYIICYIFG